MRKIKFTQCHELIFNCFFSANWPQSAHNIDHKIPLRGTRVDYRPPCKRTRTDRSDLAMRERHPLRPSSARRAGGTNRIDPASVLTHKWPLRRARKSLAVSDRTSRKDIHRHCLNHCGRISYLALRDKLRESAHRGSPPVHATSTESSARGA